MSSFIQKLIQEDILKLQARYGRDAMIAAVSEMYLLVRLDTYEKVTQELEKKHADYMARFGVAISTEGYNVWDSIEPVAAANILKYMEQKECLVALASMNAEQRAAVEAAMKS